MKTAAEPVKLARPPGTEGLTGGLYMTAGEVLQALMDGPGE